MREPSLSASHNQNRRLPSCYGEGGRSACSTVGAASLSLDDHFSHSDQLEKSQSRHRKIELSSFKLFEASLGFRCMTKNSRATSTVDLNEAAGGSAIAKRTKKAADIDFPQKAASSDSIMWEAGSLRSPPESFRQPTYEQLILRARSVYGQRHLRLAQRGRD